MIKGNKIIENLALFPRFTLEVTQLKSSQVSINVTIGLKNPEHVKVKGKR
jgi:hypothetical protein